VRSGVPAGAAVAAIGCAADPCGAISAESTGTGIAAGATVASITGCTGGRAAADSTCTTGSRIAARTTGAAITG